MPLSLTLITDQEPQLGGWYLIQDLNQESGFIIACYTKNKWWIQDSAKKPVTSNEFPWYWDNPLIIVGSDQPGSTALISS